MSRRVGLAVALVALVLPASAEAVWQYSGRVADGHRTPFKLVVRHVDGAPRLLIYASSGRLHLRCQRGTQRFRWTLDPGFPFRFEPDGHFGIVETDVSQGGGHGKRVVHTVFDGRAQRAHAAGAIRVRTRTRRHGRCDSGHLGWHARFVPRAG